LAAVAGADVVRLVDFPLTGECAEPTSLAPSHGSDEANGCSATTIVGCSAALVGITAACGGPEDLPCIAAGLSAIAGCTPCICALIGYDCGLSTTQTPLPSVEFGTCDELGFAYSQEKQVMKQDGFDLEVHVHAKAEVVAKAHVLDASGEGSCSEIASVDEINMPEDFAVASGGCVDAGFTTFDSFGSYVMQPNVTSQGCSALTITGCSAAIVGITAAVEGLRICLALLRVCLQSLGVRLVSVL